jgi:hypothetical protein
VPASIVCTIAASSALRYGLLAAGHLGHHDVRHQHVEGAQFLLRAAGGVADDRAEAERQLFTSVR